MKSIDDLMCQLKNLYNIKVRFDVPEYVAFKDELTKYVYGHHFENTTEWRIISNNLVYKSTQYMTYGEADMILVQLESLKRKALSNEYKISWEYIHPQITLVSKKLFLECNYIEASENAFKEIASRVRKILIKVKPSSNVPTSDFTLMTTTFSEDTPIIRFCDTNNTSGKNTQKGFMHMAAGAMSALRNPNAHSNDHTVTEDDCVRQLMFASMLMYKIDEAVEYSSISK